MLIVGASGRHPWLRLRPVQARTRPRASPPYAMFVIGSDRYWRTNYRDLFIGYAKARTGWETACPSPRQIWHSRNDPRPAGRRTMSHSYAKGGQELSSIGAEACHPVLRRWLRIRQIAAYHATAIVHLVRHA